MPLDEEYIERLQRDLIARGKLIEAGWARMRAIGIPLSAPQAQVESMRTAFFMGAHYLYQVLEDPTEDDEGQVRLIVQELEAFITEFSLRYVPSDGTA
jgi:hypothetical protein